MPALSSLSGAAAAAAAATTAEAAAAGGEGGVDWEVLRAFLTAVIAEDARSRAARA